MDKQAIAYADYWRNSLADAALGKGGLRNEDVKQFKTLSLESLEKGCVDHAIADELFKGRSKDVMSIQVAFRPRVFLSVKEHGQAQRSNGPEIVAPILCLAKMDRGGRLYPTAGAVICRDILEPLGRGSFSIGDLSDMDLFLTENAAPEFDGKSDAQSFLITLSITKNGRLT